MKLRPSPATVIAVIALVISLTGTAFAAGVFTKKQKKQVTTLATKVFDSKIGSASVQRAATAGSAETAAKATEALKAVEATKAMEALRAGTATRADVATKADEATKATEAATATEAAHADSADRATTAADAEKLGGQLPSSYQDRVGGTCPGTESISKINADGSVVCTSPVRPIRIELGAGGTRSVNLGNGLSARVACNNLVEVALTNSGAANGNLNRWLLSQGVTQVGGATLLPGQEFNFTSPGRGEAQFIWSPEGTATTTTLLIHLFRSAGGGFCELTGTALTASG